MCVGHDVPAGWTDYDTELYWLGAAQRLVISAVHALPDDHVYLVQKADTSNILKNSIYEVTFWVQIQALYVTVCISVDVLFDFFMPWYSLIHTVVTIMPFAL